MQMEICMKLSKLICILVILVKEWAKFQPGIVTLSITILWNSWEIHWYFIAEDPRIIVISRHHQYRNQQMESVQKVSTDCSPWSFDLWTVKPIWYSQQTSSIVANFYSTFTSKKIYSARSEVLVAGIWKETMTQCCSLLTPYICYLVWSQLFLNRQKDWEGLKDYIPSTNSQKFLVS